MKKFLKVLGIIILVLVIAVGIFAVREWKYIQAVIDGVRYDETQLGEKKLENTEKAIEDVNKQVSVELRPLTDEEREKIANNELSQTEVMAHILAEALGMPDPTVSTDIQGGEGAGQGEPAGQGGQPADNNQNASGQNTSASQGDTTAAPSQTTATDSDHLISAAVSELYGLQNQYTAQIDGLVSRAISYYREQKAANGASAAKSSTMSKFSGEVASMEGACDAKVEAVLSRLSNNLTEIGADTSIVSTLRGAYENEKRAQRAAYVNRYMK